MLRFCAAEGLQCFASEGLECLHAAGRAAALRAPPLAGPPVPKRCPTLLSPLLLLLIPDAGAHPAGPAAGVHLICTGHLPAAAHGARGAGAGLGLHRHAQPGHVAQGEREGGRGKNKGAAETCAARACRARGGREGRDRSGMHWQEQPGHVVQDAPIGGEAAGAAAQNKKGRSHLTQAEPCWPCTQRPGCDVRHAAPRCARCRL